MPTSWTELTVAVTPYVEGIPSPDSGTITGFALFGLPIPIDGGLAFGDTTVSWAENTVPLTSHTEMTVPLTTWTQHSG